MGSPIQGLPPISPVAGGQRLGETSSSSPSAFWDTLRTALDEVQHVQSEADQKVTQLVTGEGEDIHTAMIAVAKADLSFQLVMQVRNKIVQAYQQISQIQF
jgi:flagellar hook-basal body complex protein FliE